MNPALWLLAPLAFLVLVGPGRRHNAITLVAAATVEVIVATVIAIGGVDTGADDLLTTDATARLFLLVIDWAFVGVVVYAWNRARVDATRPEASARRAYLGIVFLVAMNVVVIANHMLHSHRRRMRDQPVILVERQRTYVIMINLMPPLLRA